MPYSFEFGAVVSRWPLLAQGAGITIAISSFAIAVGMLVGIVCARWLTSQPRILGGVAHIYVELFRNTPLLVQLYILFFVLPSTGLRLSPMTAALIGLALNNGAYCTEIVRAGITAVPHSQSEAGLSLGMSRLQVFIYVVLGPAIANVYPALVSQSIIIVLATSLVSSIGAQELTSYANFIQSENFRSFEVYLVAAGIYLVVASLFRLVFWLVQVRFFPTANRLALVEG
jgi:polar amino acid transport system permease protein